VAPLQSEYKIEPMDLANMRQNGVRSLLVMCYGCRHEVILNVDQYPGDAIFWCASSGRVECAPKAAWSAQTSGQAGKSVIGSVSDQGVGPAKRSSAPHPKAAAGCPVPFSHDLAQFPEAAIHCWETGNLL
jgi:hypothetical protein